MFRPVRQHSGASREFNCATNVEKGKLYVLAGNGASAEAESSQSEVKNLIVAEHNAQSGELASFTLVDETIEFKADTTGAVSKADIGKIVALTDGATLNQSQESGIFKITEVVGKHKVIGVFVK